MLKLHRVTTPYEGKKLLTILTSWLPWSVNCYFYCLRISSNLRRWSWNCYSYCKAFTYSPEKKRERNRKIINKFCLGSFFCVWFFSLSRWKKGNYSNEYVALINLLQYFIATIHLNFILFFTLQSVKRIIMRQSRVKRLKNVYI